MRLPFRRIQAGPQEATMTLYLFPSAGDATHRLMLLMLRIRSVSKQLHTEPQATALQNQHLETTRLAVVVHIDTVSSAGRPAFVFMS